MYVSKYVYVYLSKYGCKCMYVCMYITCVCVCIYVCMYAYEDAVRLTHDLYLLSTFRVTEAKHMLVYCL